MQRERVVIIGGGFGGLNSAKKFQNTNFEVILVDKTNHHLFQPLLYQVATAALSPSNIARPIRSILKDSENIEVILDEVISIDKDEKNISLRNNEKISFDYLVVATGAKHSYFGKDHWEEFAPGLKTLTDALTIREKILWSFEEAERIEATEKEKYLNFVVIGGGPTGVEMAGAIAETAKSMKGEFKNINPSKSKIFLIEGMERLLGMFEPSLSEYTKQTLENMGVTVLLKSMVTDINEEGVKIGEMFIPTTNIIWAAGNTASPLLKTLNTELDRTGRVIVESDLSIQGYPNIFVIGDASHAKDINGKPLPGLAPVAIQQGQYITDIIISRKAKDQRPPFRYFDKGSMATIGKAKAVAQTGNLKFKGLLAWLMWILVHVLFLIGFRNKIAAILEWVWFYITDQRSARLITDKDSLKVKNRIKI